MCFREYSTHIAVLEWIHRALKVGTSETCFGVGGERKGGGVWGMTCQVFSEIHRERVLRQHTSCREHWLPEWGVQRAAFIRQALV